MSVIIRHARENDLPAILDLQRAWLASAPTWGYKIQSASELQAVSPRDRWVAADNERIIGFALCRPRENDGSCVYKAEDRILEVADLFVAIDRRGRGIGIALLETIEKQAMRDGFTKLFVYSSVQDLQAVLAFYKRAGFVSWAVQMFKDIGLG